MRRPNAAALRHAALWLECYDGEPGQPDTKEQAAKVAEWLRHQAFMADTREACPKGITQTAFRRRVKEVMKQRMQQSGGRSHV